MNLACTRDIARLLGEGERVVLVQPLLSEGSVPTPRGACMIVSERDALGTVGGGALEAEALVAAREVMRTGTHRLLDLSLDGDGSTASDMVCGGRVVLLLETLEPKGAGTWAEAETEASRGRCVVWRLTIERGEMVCVVRRLEVDPSPTDPLVRDACEAGAAVVATSEDRLVMVDPVLVPEVLLVFGAGHVAAALVPIAASLGFSCVVVDDREEYASPQRFPTASGIVVVDPAEAVDELPCGPGTWAAVMTRGHKDDERVLRKLLGKPYRYVGMMGSARKWEGMRARLVSEGVAQGELDRVHCPIGLPIGGTTPQEIAVSIAAELVAIRSGSPTGPQTWR